MSSKAAWYPNAQLCVPVAGHKHQSNPVVHIAHPHNQNQQATRAQPVTVNQVLRPVSAITAVSVSQGLAAINIMLTVLLLYVVAMFFRSAN